VSTDGSGTELRSPVGWLPSDAGQRIEARAEAAALDGHRPRPTRHPRPHVHRHRTRRPRRQNAPSAGSGARSPTRGSSRADAWPSAIPSSLASDARSGSLSSASHERARSPGFCPTARPCSFREGRSGPDPGARGSGRRGRVLSDAPTDAGVSEDPGWLRAPLRLSASCRRCAAPSGAVDPVSSSRMRSVASARSGVPEVVLAGSSPRELRQGSGHEPPLSPSPPRRRAASCRVRLSSLEPMEAGAELVDLVATSRAVVPHLICRGSRAATPVLGGCAAGSPRPRYQRLALRAATRQPRLHLATDLIAGFPGETPADSPRPNGSSRSFRSPAFTSSRSRPGAATRGPSFTTGAPDRERRRSPVARGASGGRRGKARGFPPVPRTGPWPTPSSSGRGLVLDRPLPRGGVGSPVRPDHAVS